MAIISNVLFPPSPHPPPAPCRFADYGTMLEIRDIQYFPDGRAVVDAVGTRRFRVLSRDMRDGYHTAKVAYLRDERVDDPRELEGGCPTSP